MAKGTILTDTFEQLAELGQSTAKTTVKSVAQAINPLNALPGSELASTASAGSRGETEIKNSNYTALDYARLQGKYANQDTQKMDQLRNRLFQMVKQDEEKVLQQKKQERQQSEQQEDANKKQKQKQKEDQRQNDAQDTLPKGKQRKGMFSPKKKSTEQLTERKADASKN